MEVTDSLTHVGGLLAVIGVVTSSWFALVHLAAAEGCFIHFLALVHLLVAHQLCLLLLKLEISYWLRSRRGAVGTFLLERFKSLMQYILI